MSGGRRAAPRAVNPGAGANGARSERKMRRESPPQQGDQRRVVASVIVGDAEALENLSRTESVFAMAMVTYR